jgi:hypothetical protein
MHQARPALVLEMAEELWKRKHDTWPGPSMSILLGCGLASFNGENNKVHPAKGRLYMIIMSESLHLIWKLRYECVNGRGSTPPTTINEVQNRWFKLLSERLEMPRLAARKNF